MGGVCFQSITEPFNGLIISVHLQHADQSQTDMSNSCSPVTITERRDDDSDTI